MEGIAARGYGLHHRMHQCNHVYLSCIMSICFGEVGGDPEDIPRDGKECGRDIGASIERDTTFQVDFRGKR